MDRLFRIDFYPQEWLVHTGQMTPAQRGVFIQIISMIYANRGPIENDPAWIGRNSNCSPRLARAIISELVISGSLQIEGSKITQKRCERELNIKRTRLELSAKGGRKSAENRDEDRKNNDMPTSEPCKPVSSSSPSPTPSLLVFKESERAKPRQTQENFAEFWTIYPRHVAKQSALKAYTQARQRGVSHEDIIAGARQFADECRGREQRWIAHPATWLNAGRWDDEPGANLDARSDSAKTNGTGGHRPGPKSRGELVAELIGELPENQRGQS